MHRTKIKALLLLVTLFACGACASRFRASRLSRDDAPTADRSSTATIADAAASEPTDEPSPAPSPTPDPPIAARVNGEPIYLADYERALVQYEADLRAQGVDPESDEGLQDLAHARTWILNVMIEQVLTEQAADQAGVVVTDEDVDAYVADMIEEYGGEEAFDARLAELGDTRESAWQKSRSGLIGMVMMERITEAVPTKAKHVHARHILVDTEQEAQSLLDQLQAGADFVALAQAYSHDSSTKETGGDLGFFPRGILVAPEVEDVAFSLGPGQISDVVASALGYHILQVIEVKPDLEISPENRRLLQDQAVQKWIEELWAEADVEVFVETPS